MSGLSGLLCLYSRLRRLYQNRFLSGCAALTTRAASPPSVRVRRRAVTHLGCCRHRPPVLPRGVRKPRPQFITSFCNIAPRTVAQRDDSSSDELAAIVDLICIGQFDVELTVAIWLASPVAGSGVFGIKKEKHG